ncbi:UNVERIFIED_CONTAM: hypothetical protein HDU68_002383 [Siphonaria sp. JEL0065]|nr:hypothetical protein HDU68_002383 [Siphonaria sp. JEL0065]
MSHRFNPLNNYEALSPDQLNQYLTRIHLQLVLPQEPTLELLNTIIQAHSQHIPFENGHLRFLNEKPSLELTLLFDRLVTTKRGGYCFQQNALLTAVLLALGFKATPGAARPIYWNTDLKQHSLKGPTHQIVFVEFDQGALYYVDVGYTRYALKTALPIQDGIEMVCASDEVVRLESCGEYLEAGTGFVVRHKKPEWAPVIDGVESDGFSPTVFITLERYRHDPAGLFVNSLVLSIVTKTGGKAMILDSKFKRFEGSQHRDLDQIVEMTNVTELVVILKTEFGVELSLAEVDAANRLLFSA